MKMIVHRGLSLLLCMVLLFGCLSPGFAVAFAAELDEIESTEATEATSATEAAETIPETEPSGPGQEEENAENPTEPVLEKEDEVPDGTEVPDTTEETNVTEDPGETEPQPTEEPDMPLLGSSRAMVGTCEIKSYASLRLAARYTVTVSYSLSDGGSRKSSITAINWHYIDEPENPGYCLEPNKTAPYGSDRPLETTNSTAEMTSGTVGAAAWNKLTAQQRRAIALVALYGIPNNFWDEDSGLKNYGEYVDGNLNRAYFAAGQIIVWEFVMGLRETTWPFDYTNRSDATALFDAFDGRKSFNIGYEAITKDLYEHYLLPSFAAGAKANAPTITLQPDGNGYYTATVTDTNDILDKFTFEDSSGNVTFTRSGNKLTIKAKSLPSDPVFAGSKYVPSANNTSYFLAYGEDDYQTMIAIADQGADDPVYAYLKLEIPGGKIEVKKTDPNGKALAGAEFGVYNSAGTMVATIGPTDANGYAISGNLPYGTYTIKETKYPTGYTSGDTTSWTATINSSQSTYTINAKNIEITGSLKIQKATNTGKNLSGWSFGVYTDKACTKAISGSPFATTSDGTVTVTGLAPGTYYVKELHSNDNYWVVDSDVKTVKVEASKTASVTVTNTHYGYAQIVKKTNTGSNLSGWKFNIYTDEACTKLVSGSPFTTDASGLITTKLLPGDYYIREVDESATYPEWTFDTAVKKISVTAGDTKSVTFTNTQSGWIKLIKAMPDGGSVTGWVFEVYRVSDNKLVGTYTSGEDGTILSDALIPGEYQVKEIIPEDSLYVCESENPQTVTITGGKTAEVTFTNRIKPGEIEILKVNEKGNPLAGAQFRLEWSTDGTTWKIVTPSDSQYVTEGTCTSQGLMNGTLVTNAEGLATFTGLHPERLYRLTEVTAPDGYQLLTKPAYEGGLDIENELRIVIKVTNFPVYELPKTGSNSLLLMPLVGLMALTACAAIVFTTTFRRKKA